MNCKTGTLRHFLLFFVFIIFLISPYVSKASKNVISTDQHAPNYFIRLLTPHNSSVKVLLNQTPIQKLENTRISFYPQKPWTLYLLIESSSWTSPIQQNSAILTLLEKIDTPPETIKTYSFHTGVEKLETDWNIPVFLKESQHKNVALIDSIQRMIQIIANDQQNGVLCIFGSGHNTVNLTNFPLPTCPVWCIFPDDAESKKTPFLSTITTLSGGQILFFQTLEEAKIIEIPYEQQGSILHFSAPKQWFNFRKQIKVEITDHDSSAFITLAYPTPWWSLIGIVFTFLILAYIIFRLFQTRKFTQNKSSPKCYSLGWLEWNENTTEKHNKRIHLCNFTIGSSQNCHLSLQEDSVSDCHALIQEKDNGFFITDLSSRSGVWINQKKINNCQLFDRDQIQIGNIILTFRQSHIKYESNEKYL